MSSRTLIAETHTPDREALTLTFEGGHHVVRVRGEILMSSRLSGSEEALARIVFAERPASDVSRILVGGLGMGFTLRAVLEEAAPTAQVDVLELLQPVVDWNRGVLAPYAKQPLEDSRVVVIVGDVLAHLAAAARVYDAIVLDVDNGPEAFTVAANSRLYTAAGLATLHGALREGGVVAVWSAFRSPRFERLLRGAGFEVTSLTVRARGAIRKGARHTVFRAVRAGSRRDRGGHPASASR